MRHGGDEKTDFLTKDNQVDSDKEQKNRLFRLSLAMARNGRQNGSSHLNKGIPAGYTYLGQFIAHDLVLHDSRVTTFSKREGKTKPNFRSLQLDLDSIYGGGPERTPVYYQTEKKLDDGLLAGEWLFCLGATSANRFSEFQITEGKAVKTGSFRQVASRGMDLPRKMTCPMDRIINGTDPETDAVNADPRNDENVLLSQLTLLFMRAHNKIATAVATKNISDAGSDLAKIAKAKQGAFDIARRLMTCCYHEIVVKDYLLRLLNRSVHKQMLRAWEDERRDFRFVDSIWRQEASDAPKHLSFEIPKEFWKAGFRIGHVMIRGIYDVNNHFRRGGLGSSKNSIERMMFIMRTGSLGLPLRENWIVEWRRFFFRANQLGDGGISEIKGGVFPNNAKVNYSRLIKLACAVQLNNGGGLSPSTMDGKSGLLYTDFARAWADQNTPRNKKRSPMLNVKEILAKHARIVPKSDVLTQGDISKAMEELPSAPVYEKDVDLTDIDIEKLCSLQDVPLLVYLLIEAQEKQDGACLGSLGSRIVGETIIAAILSIPNRKGDAVKAKQEWLDYFETEKMPTSMPELLDFLGEPRILN